jgi:hypothetical protein
MISGMKGIDFYFKGLIKRPRICNEQDPRKTSPIQPTTLIQTGSRTLRPRQANTTPSNSLPSSPSINLHRQSSSSSTSSNHGITAMQLRSSHV